jgi:hypothetical protein
MEGLRGKRLEVGGGERTLEVRGKRPRRLEV